MNQQFLSDIDRIIVSGNLIQSTQIDNFNPISHGNARKSLPGLYHASLAHIYPDDRGVSLALGLGHRAGRAAGDWLAAQPAARSGAQPAETSEARR